MKKIMISIFDRIVLTISVCALFFTGSLAPAYAEAGQRLSVSPTLFDMRANPGQEWQSSIKIVNANPYELTVYVTAVNFAPRGEGGDGMLLPILDDEQDGVTLAEWIDYDHKPIVIPPEKTFEMPFTVRVPESAAPGGHYAAFMVGTKPPKNDGNAAEVRTAQVVTSLFFARVSGDIVESGDIREFHTTQHIYGKPEADFELRFENKGNVHLRPQGDIIITNMWGQERGTIPINKYEHFGNVLSNSIRKFDFSWRSDWSFSDIGRYTAIVTLAYGQDSRQFVTSTTYFWVLPLGLMLIALATVVVVVMASVFLIRIYVRRMLQMAGVDTEAARYRARRGAHGKDLLLTGPAGKRTAETPHEEKNAVSFLQGRLVPVVAWVRAQNRWLVLGAVAVLLIVLSLLLLWLFSAPQRSYEVTYTGTGTSTPITSDQIYYEAQRNAGTASMPSEASSTASGTPIVIVNQSGEAGAAARVAVALEANGYVIAEVRTDMQETRGKTVIVYGPDDTNLAMAMSPLLNNALLSVYGENEIESHITVYVGADNRTSE